MYTIHLIIMRINLQKKCIEFSISHTVASNNLYLTWSMLELKLLNPFTATFLRAVTLALRALESSPRIVSKGLMTAGLMTRKL